MDKGKRNKSYVVFLPNFVDVKELVEKQKDILDIYSMFVECKEGESDGCVEIIPTREIKSDMSFAFYMGVKYTLEKMKITDNTFLENAMFYDSIVEEVTKVIIEYFSNKDEKEVNE